MNGLIVGPSCAIWGNMGVWRYAHSFMNEFLPGVCRPIFLINHLSVHVPLQGLGALVQPVQQRGKGEIGVEGQDDELQEMQDGEEGRKVQKMAPFDQYVVVMVHGSFAPSSIDLIYAAGDVCVYVCMYVFVCVCMYVFC